ncbi:MAG: 4'-phosphopantetheinyl transferase superfamily protein [Fimbriimonadaceae bacterium]|nr:4'-phosphopantetheinyl transferase superfamily protein [Chitinophagales bacterium]
MALVLHEKLLTHSEFAVWRIEEDDSFYLKKLILSYSEREFINAIKHPAQKTRWLASRYLLKYLMQTDVFVELLADDQGKPFIRNFDLHISISHSNNYVAVFISNTHTVGIDVEESSRNIMALKNKFLSQTELQQLSESVLQKQLIVYWAAKEVIYKIYGKRKLEFKDDMYIKPFSLHGKGTIDGVLMKHGAVLSYNLNYYQNDDFTLVTGTDSGIEKLT